MNNDLTPKQQAAEAIRQAENILIVTGQHPSNDQVASVVAMALLLRKIGKNVTAIVSDSVSPALNFLPLSEIDKNLSGSRDFMIKVDLAKTEVDKLKYAVEEGKLNIYITPFKGGFAQSDVSFGYGAYHYDLAVVMGVPTKARIDKVFEQNPEMIHKIPLVSVDFHRSNENYAAINFVDGNASSLCEILSALAESIQNGLVDEEIATVLLAGIVSSTDRFTATHTTAKSLTVAAQLMAAGARQQQIVKSLFKGGRDDAKRPDIRPDKRDDRPRNDDRPRREETPRAAESKPAAQAVVQEEKPAEAEPKQDAQPVREINPDAKPESQPADAHDEMPVPTPPAGDDAPATNFDAEQEAPKEPATEANELNTDQLTYQIQPATSEKQESN